MSDATEASGIAASIPSSDKKIAIIGSVILEEDIIINAAKMIRAYTGAWCKGAVAFYGYGEPSKVIEQPEGPAIRSRHEFGSVREPGNSSLARGALREMTTPEDLPLGSRFRPDTNDNLPSLTKEERRIWQRIQENAKRREVIMGGSRVSDPLASRAAPSIYEEVPSTRLLVEKTIPSILGNL